MKCNLTQSENKFLTIFSEEWEKTIKKYNCPQEQMNDGSRLRPLMAFWGYLAAIRNKTPDFSYIAQVSISVELLHKATIILDDWIDGDNARHGLPAFHVTYSPEVTAILALHMVSDAILRFRDFLSDAFYEPNRYSRCSELIAQTIYSMSKGALMELKLEDDLFNLEKIKQIAYLETAEILGNAMQLGYFSGLGNNTKVSELFKSIGDRFGYLFQAMNDLEAFTDTQSLKIHKGHINNDLSISRKNIAVAMLYQIANATDKQLIEQGNFTELSALIAKYNIIQFVKDETEAFYCSLHRMLQELSTDVLSPDWINQFEIFIQKMKLSAYNKLNIR